MKVSFSSQPSTVTVMELLSYQASTSANRDLSFPFVLLRGINLISFFSLEVEEKLPVWARASEPEAAIRVARIRIIVFLIMFFVFCFHKVKHD